MLLEPDESLEAASILPSGKDEMNFAEFPIALLTDRVPKGQTSIKFEDTVYDEKRKEAHHPQACHRGIGRIRPAYGDGRYGRPGPGPAHQAESDFTPTGWSNLPGWS